jgi:hypothetical protein
MRNSLHTLTRRYYRLRLMLKGHPPIEGAGPKGTPGSSAVPLVAGTIGLAAGGVATGVDALTNNDKNK